MNPSNMPESEWGSNAFWLGVSGVLLALLVFMAAALAALLGGTSLPAVMGNMVDWLFAASSVQALWYVTRAAGIIAYLLLWFSTAWGLAVSSKIFDPVLQRPFTYDFHQFLSLLAIGFVVLHVVVLMADRYLPFSLAQVLVPFAAPYRPLWTGVGVIGLYLTLLVTVTFYLRRWIGVRTFRMIHLSSFLAFGASAVHGLLAGTDSVLPATQLMYAGTTLVIVFLTVYWAAMMLFNKPQAHATPVPVRVETRR